MIFAAADTGTDGIFTIGDSPDASVWKSRCKCEPAPPQTGRGGRLTAAENHDIISGGKYAALSANNIRKNGVSGGKDDGEKP